METPFRSKRYHFLKEKVAYILSQESFVYFLLKLFWDDIIIIFLSLVGLLLVNKIFARNEPYVYGKRQRQ